MKRVSILVPESSVSQAIADPHYCFSAVNQFLALAGKPALFEVWLVGAKKAIKLNGGRFIVQPDKLLKDVKSTDLVIVPALFGNMREAVAKKQQVGPLDSRPVQQGGGSGFPLCRGFFAGLHGAAQWQKMFHPLGLCQ